MTGHLPRALVALALLGASGCKTATIYQRGAPRKAEVEKRASEPELVLYAHRQGDGSVTLSARSLTNVNLVRRVSYSTYETSVEHSGNIPLTVAESLLGLAPLIAGPAILFFPEPKLASDDSILEVHGLVWLWFLNPFQSVMGHKLRGRVSDKELFADPPVEREYDVELPVAGLSFAYRVLDAGRAVLADGQLTTDEFGRARIEAVPPEAVGVELRGEGGSRVVFLEGAIPDPDTGAADDPDRDPDPT